MPKKHPGTLPVSCRAILFAASLGLSSFSVAEPQAGRLPDGRAFRTDAGGNQLVDYIAELELNNSTLRQQIAGLEGELEQKQASIDKTASSGCAINDKIKESDLLKGKVQKTEVKSALLGSNAAAPAVQQACPTCPVCAAQVACDCSPQISQAKQEGQESLRRAQAELAVDTQQRERELQKTKTELKESQIQLAQLQRARAASGDAAAQLTAAQSEISMLRAKLSEAGDEASRNEQQVNSDRGILQNENKNLREERDALRAAEGAFKEKIATLQQAAAKQPGCEPAAAPQVQPARQVIEEEAPQPKELKASYNAGRLNVVRDAALDSLRGKILTSLNQISGLISTRDRLYAEYSRSDHAVGFSPARPVAANGNSLQAIRSASDDAVTIRELSLLTRDVNEIRSKIEFDIGMMERMKRLSR